MNRISVTLVLFIILAGIASPVSDTLNQSLSDTQITEKNESRVSFVALSSDDDCKDRDDDGVCDEGGMVGLKLDCCSDGEIFALVRWKKGNGIDSNRQRDRFNLKEELLILSVYLFIVYLFWNNGI